MIRNVATLSLFALSFSLLAQDADPVRDKLVAARSAFAAEQKAIRKQADTWFETREDAARTAGAKKLLEQIKAERAAFDDHDELPKNAPAALKVQQEKALKALEAAYTQALKDYTAAKKTEEAEAVGTELRNIRSRLNVVDLLALVNPKKHTVSGEWTRNDKSLIGQAKDKPARLVFPYEPGEEYDLEVKCKYVSGSDSLSIGLVVESSQVLAVLDGWQSSGFYSGFDQIRGKNATANATTVKGPQLKRGENFNTVLCTVRSGKLELFVNGKSITSYKGEANELRVYSEYRVPNSKALFIFVGEGASYQFDSVVVTPVKGTGTVLK